MIAAGDGRRALDSRGNPLESPLLPSFWYSAARDARLHERRCRMLLLIALLLLAAVLFGVGFAVKWLFIVAVVVLLVALISAATSRPWR